MVVIRLKRGGTNKRPYYYVIATDKRKRRDVGDPIELLGKFNPIARGAAPRLELKRDRISYWQGVGAQLSERVASLVVEWDKKGS